MEEKKLKNESSQKWTKKNLKERLKSITKKQIAVSSIVLLAIVCLILRFSNKKWAK